MIIISSPWALNIGAIGKSKIQNPKSKIVMTWNIQNEKDKSQGSINKKSEQETENEKVLCPYCQRTATNGIKCKGICVAENDY